MAKNTELVSFVFPVHNEESNIGELYKQVKQACFDASVDYEMIYVDDGSTDRSLGVIRRLRNADPKVGYLSLSRSFGHQCAIFAGMTKASGDACITMDGDLQHPPSLIPKMIDMWRSGTEVVYTTKVDANLPFTKNLIVKASYWFISKVSGLKLNFGQSDFRLIDKKVLKVLVGMPEYHKFLRGQVSWIGFKQEGIPYNVGKRHSGVPKYSFRKLATLALDGIFSFGRYPLHLVMLFGLIVLGCSSAYILIMLTIWILKLLGIVHIAMPPGYSDLIVAICFLGSVQLVAIGILSEYVGRIYDQAKGRPVFITKESSPEALK